MNDISEQISMFAKTTGAITLVGAFDYKDDIASGEMQSYNAIIAFYPDGSIGERPYYMASCAVWRVFAHAVVFQDFSAHARRNESFSERFNAPATHKSYRHRLWQA